MDYVQNSSQPWQSSWNWSCGGLVRIILIVLNAVNLQLQDWFSPPDSLEASSRNCASPSFSTDLVAATRLHLCCYKGITPFFSMAEECSILYTCHISFTQSSVNGHWHVLALVNSAAMNIVVHISFWIVVLSAYIPRRVYTHTPKAVFCHPAYLTYMQNTSFKMPGWMNLNVKSRFIEETSTASEMQVIPTLMAESERT